MCATCSPVCAARSALCAACSPRPHVVQAASAQVDSLVCAMHEEEPPAVGSYATSLAKVPAYLPTTCLPARLPICPLPTYRIVWVYTIPDARLYSMLAHASTHMHTWLHAPMHKQVLAKLHSLLQQRCGMADDAPSAEVRMYESKS